MASKSYVDQKSINKILTLYEGNINKLNLNKPHLNSFGFRAQQQLTYLL